MSDREVAITIKRDATNAMDALLDLMNEMREMDLQEEKP